MATSKKAAPKKAAQKKAAQKKAAQKKAATKTESPKQSNRVESTQRNTVARDGDVQEAQPVMLNVVETDPSKLTRKIEVVENTELPNGQIRLVAECNVYDSSHKLVRQFSRSPFVFEKGTSRDDMNKKIKEDFEVYQIGEEPARQTMKSGKGWEVK